MGGARKLIFKLIPKVDAVVEMTRIEFNGFTLGGGEIMGSLNPFNNTPENVYYWLHQGKMIKVIVKEAGEVG